MTKLYTIVKFQIITILINYTTHTLFCDVEISIGLFYLSEKFALLTDSRLLPWMS